MCVGRGGRGGRGRGRGGRGRGRASVRMIGGTGFTMRQGGRGGRGGRDRGRGGAPTVKDCLYLWKPTLSNTLSRVVLLLL